MKASQNRVEKALLPILAAAILISIWHWSVIYTDTKVFPSPLAVVKGMQQLIHRGVLWGYIRDSLFRVASGYSLALVLGIPLGIAMGWWRGLAEAVNPMIQILRPISPLAWIPVAIVLFGISNLGTIFLVFLASLFPIVTATSNGVAGIPRMYLHAARNFGLPTWKLLARVVFPAALPQILIGLRIALGIAWLVVVAAEMIAVDSGLGYLIIDSRNAGKRYDLVIAAMLLIGVIGLLLDSLMRLVERLRPLRWGFRAN